MIRTKILLVLLFYWAGFPFVYAKESAAQKDKLPVVVDGDHVFYNSESKKIIAEGNVRITYKGVTIFCDKASVDTIESIAKVEGNVKVQQQKGTIFGDRIIYDFKNKTANISDMHMASKPFYAFGKSVRKVSVKKYVLEHGYITTCNLKKPHYRFAARKIIFYPGDKIVAKNVVFKVGDIPLFYIPYYMQPAKDKLPRVSVVPGSDHDMGMYMLTAWRYYYSESFKGRLHFDYYEKRGFGRGFTHSYNTKNLGKGMLKLYYISDKEGRSFDGYNTGRDRYKFQWRHSWNMSSKDNLRVEIHKFSDKYFMKDYFYREYERDSHPLSYALFTHSFPYSVFSLRAQKRFNDFYTETEYLPEIKLDVFSRPVGNSNFYIDSTSSFSNLSYKIADSLEDRDVLRLDSHNTLSYQGKIAWLNFKPYAGIRETFYSKDTSGDSGLYRTIFDSGIELSTKLYRLFDKGIDFLGMKADALKHIITPTIEYTYIHRPTTGRNRILQFDSIDSIDRENEIKFTLENKLQAKSGDKTWDMLYFAPAVSYVFNQEARGSHWKKLESDFEFRPVENLYLENDATYDLDNKALTEMNTDLTWKSKKCNLALGHNYTRGESSEITSSLDYEISKKLSFHSYQRFEAKTGQWEEQQYFFRRDLHCWLMDLGMDIDKDKAVSLWVIFRIKAFPEVGINFRKSYRGPKDSG